jgi:hypothetical protein
MNVSYLRLGARSARRGIAKSRRWRLRKSLMRNQGISREIATALAKDAVPQRKAKRR